MHKEIPPGLRLTDDEVRIALEAAERAEAGALTTVDDLYEAAVAAGYSRETIEQAVEHVIAMRVQTDNGHFTQPRDEREGRDSREPRINAGWLRLAVFLGGGAMIGEIARSTSWYRSDDIPTFFAMAVLVACALLDGMEHRKRGSHHVYQFDVAAMWLGFVGGWTVLNSGFSEPLMVLSSGLWGVSALVGGLIVSAYFSITRPPAYRA